ncbi:MAG: sugar ABC transporter permease [Clostridia bacterium]|nr:sugar ABC transporter permease [Clostridia bacterium]MDE7265056.1 sugar ABC transporter permease [Clostridia bacterium]
MTKKFRSKKGAERTANAAIYIILTIISIVWLLPFCYLLIQSLRGETGSSTLYFWPKEWTFNNYIKLFTDTSIYNFPRWYGTTLLISIVVTVIQSMITLITSYALSRLRFKMRKPLMNLMLVLGMFPGFMSMTAVYFILKLVGLTQNMGLVGLILVYVASSCMGYYISKGFFDTIPKSLDEAARIDGASRQVVFFKIILPLAKPIIIYTVLTAFMAPWGEYMFASLIANGSQENFNVAVGLWQMLQRETKQQYFTRFCAASVLISIPITVLFFCLQRYYVQGVTGGSVKG